MNMKEGLIDFVSTFLIVLVVASLVTCLWNLSFHDSGTVDWETSFRLAIIFGIVLPWVKARERQPEKNLPGDK